MLCTERGPTLLPLVIYVDSDSLDVGHVPQVRDDVILGVGISGRRCRSAVLESDPWQVIRDQGTCRDAPDRLAAVISGCVVCCLAATAPAPALPARMS